MLLSDLLHTPVVDADGHRIGRVLDTLLIQDGPVVGGFGAQLRVEGLAIGRRSVAVRMGFHRAGVRGPAPLRWLMERDARRARYAPWDAVDSVTDDLVTLTCRLGDLDEPPTL